MKSFLSAYWAWIVVPMLLVFAAAAALLLAAPGDAVSPFVYNVF